MQTLFDTSPVLPSGFQYLEDFISEEQERALIRLVQELDLRPLVFQVFQAKRKVESYGYDYHFDSRKIRPGKQIPEGLMFLIEAVARHLHKQPKDFKEVLVTEYPPGSVINWHRDAPPFELIVGISLQEDCVFKLRPYDKSKRARKAIISVPIRRRSLYVMEGIVRDEWEHSTAPVNQSRYSITLRTLRG